MINSRQGQWLYLLVCGLIVLKTESVSVPITCLESAKEKGAVCLDGSAPAYSLDNGVGDGVNKWLIFLEGGGWCYSTSDCYLRSNTYLGSSNQWNGKNSTLLGMLSNAEKSNPYFYNWNRVLIRYCDGSSYVGDLEQPNIEKDHPLYFRGARVFDAIVEDLLAKGLQNASHALLAGCSAGGLGAMLQCDNFRSLLPTSTKVKCAADGSYFVDATDIYGGHYIRDWFEQVIETHGSAKHLPESCKSKMNASLCMFPQNFAADIQTPLFIINSAYDFWQVIHNGGYSSYMRFPSYVLSWKSDLQNIKVPHLRDTKAHDDLFVQYSPCRNEIENCTCDQVKVWHDFEGEFNQALSQLSNSTSTFITSCSSHCHTLDQERWLGEATKIENVGVGEALCKWFNEDITVRNKDDIHKTPIVCGYDAAQPNWNNNYTWGGKPINPNYTTQDEINRKSKLVPLCPAQVPCYGATTRMAQQCPTPAPTPAV